jgi:hypothetical protein
VTPEEAIAHLGGRVDGGYTEWAVLEAAKNGGLDLYPALDEKIARGWIDNGEVPDGTLVKRRWVHGPWQEDVDP